MTFAQAGLAIGVIAMTLGSQVGCVNDALAKDGSKGAASGPTSAPAKVDAVLAGGCFWCTEAVFEQLKGVSDVVSGYTGGSAADANYEAVCNRDTGHAEAIRITFDPSVISYEELLVVFFTVAHDPTTLNRQGNDVGTQYRSAIFWSTPAEKAAAEKVIAELTATGAFRKPIVTTLEPLKEFYVAEAYHQDYAACNPNKGYIIGAAMPKVAKLREKYADRVKPRP